MGGGFKLMQVVLRCFFVFFIHMYLCSGACSSFLIDIILKLDITSKILKKSLSCVSWLLARDLSLVTVHGFDLGSVTRSA